MRMSTLIRASIYPAPAGLAKLILNLNIIQTLCKQISYSRRAAKRDGMASILCAQIKLFRHYLSAHFLITLFLALIINYYIAAYNMKL